VKILHVISSVDPRDGGPIECIKQMAAEMTRLGHTTEIASLDAPDAPYLPQCPIKVHALGPGISSYQYTTRFVPWLKSVSASYDAVVVNGVWQYHSFGVWRALRDGSVRYFVFPHGMLDPWFKRRYPLKHLKKWMVWPWADYRVLRDARAVLFTCEEERLRARESFWLYRATECVASLGTAGPAKPSDALKDAFWHAYPHLRDREIVLFLGRIHPKKACDLLIEAFAAAARNADVVLAFAGPDETGWSTKLRQIADRAGVGDRVEWLGMVEADVKWGAYHAASVFALPSHQENFGISVIEALATGTPVLVSNKVNIWREIVDAGAGFVDDDTLEGATRLLSLWFALDADARRAMSEHALVCFQTRFRSETMAAQLIDVLASA
jgi:glycosyltransferase involved in cell wall biosynthesis